MSLLKDYEPRRRIEPFDLDIASTTSKESSNLYGFENDDDEDDEDDEDEDDEHGELNREIIRTCRKSPHPIKCLNDKLHEHIVKFEREFHNLKEALITERAREHADQKVIAQLEEKLIAKQHEIDSCHEKLQRRSSSFRSTSYGHQY
jgi:signal recognition particle GTPase